jgi:hypothetical protein
MQACVARLLARLAPADLEEACYITAMRMEPALPLLLLQLQQARAHVCSCARLCTHVYDLCCCL